MKKRKVKQTGAVTRGDGNATKALIIDCAGKLIAKHGFAKTTSKSIIEKANTNTAAVNYHFGSRENLYLAVLEEVHKHMINIGELRQLWSGGLNPKEKIEAFIDLCAANAFEEDCWHVKVWVREIVNPSPFIYQVLSKEALPKLAIVAKIFGEYTGLSSEDPRLYSCIFNVMSPFILSFLVHYEAADFPEVLPVKYTREEQISHFKRFAFAGLDEFKKTSEQL